MVFLLALLRFSISASCSSCCRTICLVVSRWTMARNLARSSFSCCSNCFSGVQYSSSMLACTYNSSWNCCNMYSLGVWYVRAIFHVSDAYLQNVESWGITPITECGRVQSFCIFSCPPSRSSTSSCVMIQCGASSSNSCRINRCALRNRSLRSSRRRCVSANSASHSFLRASRCARRRLVDSIDQRFLSHSRSVCWRCSSSSCRCTSAASWARWRAIFSAYFLRLSLTSRSYWARRRAIWDKIRLCSSEDGRLLVWMEVEK